MENRGLQHRHSSLSQKIGNLVVGGVLVLGLVLFASLLKSQVSATNSQAQSTLVSPESGLVYLQTDSHGRPSAIKHKPRADFDTLTVDHSSTLASAIVPGECEISGLHAAPHGHWVAVQVDCEAAGFVQIVQTASGQARDLGPEFGSDSIFLGWVPTGNQVILKVNVATNPRVYLMSVASGQAALLPVPATAYDVAISENGHRMVYSLTRGLGYGSETWIADVDGQNARRVIADPTHIIAFARWSPSGDRIVYLRLPDSNVPFPVGELWVMDSEGNHPISFGEADAGHGYEPAWSPDGLQVAFVGRENRHDAAADQSPTG